MKAFPRDVTLQTMKIRHIGVENELGIKGQQGRYASVDITAIEKEISKRGLLQSVGHDGGGREFRTNPISIKALKQVRGFKYVTEYYGILKQNTTVLTTGGTHIHISILNSDHENMESNATAMAIAFYEQFQKIAGRKSNWASCGRQRTLEQVRERLNSYRCGGRQYSRMGTMLSPTYHQTLEFRGGVGTNDCEEVLAWVEFLNNVVKLSNRKSVEGVQFKKLLKGERISAYVANLKGWRKLKEADLEQKFKGSALRKAAA